MDESADLELQALARSEIKMNSVVRNSAKQDGGDSFAPSSSSRTIEVKDVSDSELQGGSVDQTESQRDADSALKRQKRLERIAAERSEKDNEQGSVHVSIGDLMGEVETDDVIEQANHEESERVVAK